MIYREFKDMKWPYISFGTMRLPETDCEEGVSKGTDNVDAAATEKMIDYAMSRGVNYFDTAYDYHLGNSEKTIGKILSKYPRDSWLIADKFPGYNPANMDKIATIFPEQLERCDVEYFDYYMYHNVCEMTIDGYLDPVNRIHEYMMAAKADGRIRHLGFSSHGDVDNMRRFLEAHGKDMEFCQIQLNYLDYEFQDAREKLKLLEEYDLPVIVMEPMRGGLLAKLSPDREKKLRALRPTQSPADWAHAFLQSLPQVATVLSGMSSFAQMKENIEIFEDPKSLDDEEMKALMAMAGDMLKGKTVPCTACNYCGKHCPVGIDIPRMMSLYNEHNFSDGGFIAPFAVMSVDEDKRPDKCIDCGACKTVCPQKIQVPEVMKDFAEQLKKAEF